MKKRYVSWEEVENYVNYTAKEYKNTELKGVYGLPRGGLVLAVMISHRMNIPLLMAPIQDCLIVDDICDSGESLLHYEQNSSAFDKPLYHITTMFYRENASVNPELFMEYKYNDWIVFPWEEKEE